MRGRAPQVPWDKLTNALWNVIFTFFQVLMLGMFDQDVSAESLMRYPHLYRSGQRNDFVRRRALAAHTHILVRSCLHAGDCSSTCRSSLAGSSMPFTTPWCASERERGGGPPTLGLRDD
jgi:hypothetical protein